MAGASHRAVDHQYRIRAPSEAVFRAITDPVWLTRWLCDSAELTPKTGGTYALGWKDGPTHRGTIVDFRPSRLVAFQWSWPGVELEGTVLSWSVEPVEEDTLLRVRHEGFPRREEWTDLYGGAEWGWTYFAMNLKSLLEHGHDLRAKDDG